MLEIYKPAGPIEVYKAPPKVVTIKVDLTHIGAFASLNKAIKVEAVVAPVKK